MKPLKWLFFRQSGRYLAYDHATGHTFRIQPYGLVSCCTIFANHDVSCRTPIAVVGQLIVPSVGEAMRRAEEWRANPFELPTFLPALVEAPVELELSALEEGRLVLVDPAAADHHFAGPGAAQGGL
jgi:hypothetical protein